MKLPFAEEVLELVNIARTVRGLEPLEAIRVSGAVRNDPDRCLLARAIDCQVVGRVMGFRTYREAYLVSEAFNEDYCGFGEVPLPAALLEVMARFDAAELDPRELQIVPPPEQLSLADTPAAQAEAIMAEGELRLASSRVGEDRVSAGCVELVASQTS